MKVFPKKTCRELPFNLQAIIQRSVIGSRAERKKKKLGRKGRKKWNQYWRMSFSACSNWLWIQQKNVLAIETEVNRVLFKGCLLLTFILFFITLPSIHCRTKILSAGIKARRANSGNAKHGSFGYFNKLAKQKLIFTASERVPVTQATKPSSLGNRWAIYIQEWGENK